MVFVAGSFCLPYVLLCIYLTEKWLLVRWVVLLHTAVVLMWGIFEPVPLFSAIVLVDLPLLPLYLTIEPRPSVALLISVVCGGAAYAAIAFGLLRLRSNAALKKST